MYYCNKVYAGSVYYSFKTWEQNVWTGCTYRCVENRRLILATCSLWGSMPSSFSSMLCFLLLGLMGGGAVLWLLTVEDIGCILDSPRSAASPARTHNTPAINRGTQNTCTIRGLGVNTLGKSSFKKTPDYTRALLLQTVLLFRKVNIGTWCDFHNESIMLL